MTHVSIRFIIDCAKDNPPERQVFHMNKKIVLTGGGTMGHVTPNLALLPHLLEKGYEVHYIGTEKGVEADKLQAIDGITYHAV